MEVMNRAELTQNDILVGQKSVTRSFGVSDDPMLMSMLSTGFYQNPLRTMIQEIMFNAWDAHRMGNCQDRPIDIYMNETTGLIIRDYGPGIEPGENDDNMHEIYCMYGGSTKRKMKNQTGGFGLGSKSPFAYTESFTVTSHFGGTKNMYLISRVSDANGGKPGMTSLVRVPTTETGLMVTVPIKEHQLHRAYGYVKDLLYLSGIKAMIHYMDDADEYIDSKSLGVGEYDSDPQHKGGDIYAVYGGVRYRIPMDDHYSSEYQFMKLLAKDRDVFVGFAPDTLSPLPNREGLNMGEKSKENVKTNLELCMEKFTDIFEPIIKAFYKVVFDQMKDQELQYHFAFIKASLYGFNHHAVGTSKPYSDALGDMAPTGTDPSVWKIAIEIVLNQTKALMSIYTHSKCRTIFLKAYIAAYPEGKDLAFAAMKRDMHQVFPISNMETTIEFVSDFCSMKFLRDSENFIREMKKAFPQDDTLHPTMRVYIGDDWIIPLRDRAFSNRDRTKYGVNDIAATDPKLVRKPSGFNSLTSLYLKNNGEHIEYLMMDKTVILVKTASVLKTTSINSNVSFHGNITKDYYRYSRNLVALPVPAFIVYERKGAYKKALNILLDAGFDVIQGKEPERKVYVPKKKEEITYSKIAPRCDNWQSDILSDQFPDPTHFFYATLADLKGYNSDVKPDDSLAFWFLKNNPKTVTVTHKRVAESLIAKGVVPIHEAVIKWYEECLQDKDRMTNIIRASKISTLCPLSNEILRDPYIQLELGMEPVDPIDTDFWHESEGYVHLSNTRYHPLYKLQRQVREDLERLWLKDPEKKNIEKMCKKTKILNNHEISSLWSSTTDSKKSQLVDKIITAINLFT